MKLFIYKNLNDMYELIEDDGQGHEGILETNTLIEPLIEKLKTLIRTKHKVTHYAYDISSGEVIDYVRGDGQVMNGKKFCGIE